jgi:hypothetical protein
MCVLEEMRSRRRGACVNGLALWLALSLPVNAVGDILSTTQTVAVTVSSYGKVSVPGSVSLRSADTRFGALSGTLTVSYWARTSEGGGGSLTVQASEFSPSGGPVASTVSYGCSGATLGSACSGTQSLSTATQTSVVSLPSGACTGGGGVCSSQDTNTVLVAFTVPSKPHYKTATYSAQITFTISTI